MIDWCSYSEEEFLIIVKVTIFIKIISFKVMKNVKDFALSPFPKISRPTFYKPLV